MKTTALPLILLLASCSEPVIVEYQAECPAYRAILTRVHTDHSASRFKDSGGRTVTLGEFCVVIELGPIQK